MGTPPVSSRQGVEPGVVGHRERETADRKTCLTSVNHLRTMSTKSLFLSLPGPPSREYPSGHAYLFIAPRQVQEGAVPPRQYAGPSRVARPEATASLNLSSESSSGKGGAAMSVSGVDLTADDRKRVPFP